MYPDSTSAALSPLIRTDHLSLLLVQAGEKNRRAFAELFRHYGPLIKGFAIQHANYRFPVEAADELVQEVMLKVWLKADNFDPSKSSANTWVYTVMRNCRIDLVRRGQRRNFEGCDLDVDDLWDESEDHSPFSVLQQGRQQQQIAQGFEQLPLEQKQALTFVYMHGKSHAEMAEETGLPLGTVKSRVRMGLKKLHTLFKTGEGL
ncbi:MAG: polymerase sigma factor RpoE [Pseudomonadota bacterium]|jgi:RNA polymerase sigma-70 factor (ECF subfamily)